MVILFGLNTCLWIRAVILYHPKNSTLTVSINAVGKIEHFMSIMYN